MKNTLLRQALAELIGTFVLVFVGGFAVVVVPLAGGGNTVIVPALGHGLALIGIIYAYGHISGAHVNPAVTVGLLVGGKIDLPRSGVYITAQFAGGILAALAIVALVPEGVRPELFPGMQEGGTVFNFGQTTGALTESHVWVAAAFEAVMAFLLVSTVYQVAVYGKAENLAAVAIGMTLAGLIFAGGNMTGASINPARTLGPALTAGEFDYILPYFVGLFAGGAAAGLLHGTLLAPAEEAAAA